MGVDRDRDWVLIRAWFLQGRKLAIEKSRRHEVVVASRHPVGDQVLVTLEVDQAGIDDDQPGAAGGQCLASNQVAG